MNYKKLGYLCLDYFTRTWTAFWGTLAFCIGYIVWQHVGGVHHFDSFPYLGLCTVVTLLSYFQNIIIMTIQREDHEIQRRLDILEEARDQKVYEMVEDIFEEVVEEDPPSSATDVALHEEVVDEPIGLAHSEAVSEHAQACNGDNPTETVERQSED